MTTPTIPWPPSTEPFSRFSSSAGGWGVETRGKEVVEEEAIKKKKSNSSSSSFLPLLCRPLEENKHKIYCNCPTCNSFNDIMNWSEINFKSPLKVTFEGNTLQKEVSPFFGRLGSKIQPLFCGPVYLPCCWKKRIEVPFSSKPSFPSPLLFLTFLVQFLGFPFFSRGWLSSRRCWVLGQKGVFKLPLNPPKNQ